MILGEGGADLDPESGAKECGKVAYTLKDLETLIQFPNLQVGA